MMFYLPESSRLLRVGGKMYINYTVRNPFGVLPSRLELEQLGFRVIQQDAPLASRFLEQTFRLTDGKIIPAESMRTSILVKYK